MVWQLAAVELHDIMQVVTAEVTFVVCGGTAVEVCAKAVFAAKMPDQTAVETANTIARRRILAS